MDNIEKLRAKLLESLEKDYDKWTIDHCAGYDMSWTQYESPKYGSISFVIGHLNFGTAVFIKGMYAYSLNCKPWNMFGKQARLELAVKKYIKDREKKAHEAYISEQIKRSISI